MRRYFESFAEERNKESMDVDKDISKEQYDRIKSAVRTKAKRTPKAFRNLLAAANDYAQKNDHAVAAALYTMIIELDPNLTSQIATNRLDEIEKWLNS